jgi:flagellar hook-length control protein FliK
MNLGELKLQVNSQLQLNNDWFVSKNNNQNKNFDKILKKASIERSEVEREPSQKIDNSTMDKDAASIKRSSNPLNDQIKELKEQIKKEIARKKFQRENELPDDPVPQYDAIKEQLAALDIAIKEKLGLTEGDAKDVVAEVVGVDIGQLVEMFTNAEVSKDTEKIIGDLVEQLVSEDLPLEKVMEEVIQVMESLPKEKIPAMEAFVSKLVDTMPDGEVKEQLVELVKEQLPEVEVSVKTESQELDKTTKDQSVEKPLDTEMKQEDVKVEVKTKTETETKGNEDKEHPVFKDTKVTMAKKQPTIEDQVMMMKGEPAMLQDTKIVPKVALTRNVMNQVMQGVKMSVNMSDQGSEILIKLNPKHLGNVELKMAFEGEKLVAQIQVENQTVKSIIDSNLDDLRNALKDSGYNVEGLEVSVNQDDTDQREQAFEQLFKGKRRRFVEEEEVILEEVNLVSDKEVDYVA